MMPKSGQGVVLKATPSSYLVLGAIFGFLTLLAGLAASSDRGMMPALLVCALVWILVYAWLSRLRIIVSTESFSYRTLFGGAYEYRFSEIQKISVESGVREYSDRFKPFVRLVVTPTEEFRSRPLYVNLKVFSHNDLKLLYGALREAFARSGRPDIAGNL